MLLVPANLLSSNEPTNMVLSKVRSWSGKREDNNNINNGVKRELIRASPDSQKMSKCKDKFYFFY